MAIFFLMKSPKSHFSQTYCIILLCYVVFSPRLFFFLHSVPSPSFSLPNSPVLISTLISTPPCFVFSPSFHIICFWSHCHIFRRANASWQKTAPLLSPCPFIPQDNKMRNSFCYQFIQFLRTTAHIYYGCASPWQQQSGRLQPGLRGRYVWLHMIRR